MNNVVLMGRLTRDPELRYVQANGNTAVVRFNIAVDKNLSREKRQEMESRNQPTADFINCVAWGKLGENITKYTGKGLRVLVTGRIQTGSYERDGQRVYTTEVLTNNIEFIDWKDGNNSNYSNNTSSNSSSNNSDDFVPPIDDDFEYSADFDPTEDKRIPF
ncbi:single-stranded DNA-binding protein [Helcococcus sueciensis]|uniref:single-stranded DNA-binding protein n=1 Tax=Helcococcus sueciensis TaxID=241555 RepID=UPI000422B0EE|nr:single-stranded DNA-binding protein [Helcococcus sueciensis]